MKPFQLDYFTDVCFDPELVKMLNGKHSHLNQD